MRLVLVRPANRIEPVVVGFERARDLEFGHLLAVHRCARIDDLEVTVVNVDKRVV